jgi:hypothetical protein
LSNWTNLKTSSWKLHFITRLTRKWDTITYVIKSNTIYKLPVYDLFNWVVYFYGKTEFSRILLMREQEAVDS